MNNPMTSPADPFRFDDRTGHYGSAQADLAPVSPLPAAPRGGDGIRPLDPMGASPNDGRMAEEGPTASNPVDRIEAGADTRSDTQVSTTAQSGTVSAQSGSGVVSQAAAVAEPRTTPVDDEAAATQTVLLRSQANMRVDAEVRADDFAVPVISSGTPVSLLPEATPEAAGGPGGFAEMAARMDQMMAEMTARMEAVSPRPAANEKEGDAGTDLFADAQDRLDDLFGSLGDRLSGDTRPETGDAPDLFEAERDRLDELAGGLGSRDPEAAQADLLSTAAARLDDLKTGLGRDDRSDAEASAPLPSQSMLARLFDGDAASDAPAAGQARLAELLGELDDPTFVPPVLDFDPGRWDDLPDFG